MAFGFLDIFGSSKRRAALQVLDVVETDGAVAIASAPGAPPAGPPIVVLADPSTVERLARAASLGLLSIAIVGDDPSPTTDTFAETADR